MVTIVGKVYEPSGLPTTAPFKVWLVSYGTDPQTHRLYVSPAPQTVTPDPITGEFSFEVWANVTGDIPCYYRVQFDFGLQLKLLVPDSETPLEFTDLIVDDTVELIPGILNRVARLESTGGVVLPTQNFSLGGWATSPPVPYDGTAPVVIPVDSFNSQGLTGVIPKDRLSGSYNIGLDNALTFGSGLTGSTGTSYSGGTANTLAVDSSVARRTDPEMANAREWLAATVSQVEAETGTGIGRRAWTPERVWQAITGYLSQYLPSATPEEAELGTGTDNRSWSPSLITALVSNYTQSNGVQSVAGKVGAVTLVPSDITGLGDITNASNLLTGVVNSALVPLAQTATKLATARTINGVSFDGTANIVVPTPSSLTFGTGLVAGSFNGSSATTLAIDTGVVVQQSDSRLTDAREWSALTVTQAEAEAGTSTARRAFTAQRVAQAILGWWNNSIHKVKLDSIQTGAQVNTVTSVASKTGAVTLVPGDVGLGNVPNVNTTIATNITTGTLPDSRLSSNVVLENAGNVFTATQTIAINQWPGLTLESTGAGTNLKRWLITAGPASDNNLLIQTRGDDNSFLGTWFSIGRTGNVSMPGTATSTVFRAVNDNLNRFEQNKLILRGASPTVYLRTTGGRSAMIHNNGQICYLLSGDTDSEVWSIAPGRTTWPMRVDLTSNAVTLDGSVETVSTVNATSRTSAASIKTAGGIACAGDIYANKVSYTQDDFLEFTPTLSGSGWVYTTQYGRYIRQGRRVDFIIIIGISTVGSSGGTLVQGLPFTTLTHIFSVNFRPSLMQNLPANYCFTPYASGNVIVLEYTTGTGANNVNITSSNYTSSTSFYLAGSYITAS